MASYVETLRQAILLEQLKLILELSECSALWVPGLDAPRRLQDSQSKISGWERFDYPRDFGPVTDPKEVEAFRGVVEFFNGIYYLNGWFYRVDAKMVARGSYGERAEVYPVADSDMHGAAGFFDVASVESNFPSLSDYWVDADEVIDLQLFTATPRAASANVVERAKPVQRQHAQEQEIRRIILELGYSVDGIPKPVRGRRGLKADVWDRVQGTSVFQSRGVFDKAWERLRKSPDFNEV